MTNEEILAAAKDAGIEKWWDTPNSTNEGYQRALLKMGKIIEKRTIEKCAAVCDVEWNGDSDTYEYSIAANGLAAAIRALGEQ